MSNKLILRSLLLTITMLIVPVLAQAIGLGNIKVSSELNSPFRAEIPVTSLRKGDKDSFDVRLASSSEFAKAGLERGGSLSQLKFKLIYRKGEPIIQVTSKEAMKEPFLSFLVSASTKNSKLLREYTVLLDPPTSIYTPKPAKPAVKPTRSAPKPAVQAKTSTTPESTAQAATPYTYTPDTHTSAPSLAGASSYGTVQRGETLWSIASQVRPDVSVSMEQMMLAIVKANPNAFTSGNVNGLRTGVNLNIPTKEEVIALSRREAISEVSAQHAIWKGMTKVIPAENSSSDAAEQNTSTSDSATSDKDSSNSMNSEEVATAKLALSATSDTDLDSDQELVAMGNEQTQVVNEQLTLAKEIIEGQAQERLELEEKMTAMTEQIETQERIIALKDAGLAQLQSQLEDSGIEPVAPLESNDNVDTTAETLESSEMSSVDDEPMDGEDVQVDETAEMQGELTEDGSVDVASEKISGDVFPPVLLAEETQAGQYDNLDSNDTSEIEQGTETEDMTEIAEEAEVADETSDASTIEVLANDVTDAGTGIVTKITGFLKSLLIPILLVLGGVIAWFFVRSRKQQSLDDSEESWDATTVSPQSIDEELTTDVIGTETVLEADGVQASANISVSDLVLEADTYVNYGDYEKAKSVLEGAKQLEPNNSVVNGKLLSVLHQQQDADGFTSMVESVGEQLKQDDPTQWEQVVAWGKELSPTHALFGGVAAAASGIAAMSMGDTDNAEQEVESGLDLSNFDIEDDPLELPEIDLGVSDTLDASSSFDLNTDDALDVPLEFNSPADAAELVSEVEEKAVDLELGVDDALDVPLEFNSPADVVEKVEEISSDPLNSEPEGATAEASSDDAVSGMVSEIEAETTDFDEMDEVATKLDLASAYLDMDEPEGARTILQEVLQEGTAEQQVTAQGLLDSLG